MVRPCKPGADLSDEPRPTDGAAADHDGGRARFGQAATGVRERADIAIGDDRDADGLDDRRDGLPVGLALVELLPRAAVDGDRLDARAPPPGGPVPVR